MTPELKEQIARLETLKQAVDRAAVVEAPHDPSHEARYREACRNAVPALIAALREQEAYQTALKSVILDRDQTIRLLTQRLDDLAGHAYGIAYERRIALTAQKNEEIAEFCLSRREGRIKELRTAVAEMYQVHGRVLSLELRQRSDISGLKAEVARLKKELSECTESHQKRNAELAELEHKEEEQAKRISELEAEVARLNKEIKRFRGQPREVTGDELDEVRQRLGRVEDDASSFRRIGPPYGDNE